MKPAIMELGGHSPVIVCDDVDPAATGKMSAVAKSRNAGQEVARPRPGSSSPTSSTHRFTEALAAQAEAIKVGNGLDPNVQMGPLANERRLAAMEARSPTRRPKARGSSPVEVASATRAISSR